MKNIDVKKLELDAIKKMLELGAAEVCPELGGMFAKPHGVVMPDPCGQSASSNTLRL